MYYPGHVQRTPVLPTEPLQEINARLGETIRLFRSGGLSTEVISGGSTPMARASHLIDGTTEIRPGTYVYNDMNCVHAGLATIDQCAARMLCTVVSDAVPDQIVIDAGSKALSSDRCGPSPDSGFGYVVELPHARIAALTEEHGQIDVRACSERPKVGDRLHVIPNHICPCVNLHQEILWCESHQMPEMIPVEARGMVY
jgi:D-serine deaminase-like pyridoxal phosphate-dependent protein